MWENMLVWKKIINFNSRAILVTKIKNFVYLWMQQGQEALRLYGRFIGVQETENKGKIYYQLTFTYEIVLKQPILDFRSEPAL